MRTETIFTMTSPYRDDFRIKAYIFGEGQHTLAIVGAMRGDEIQQQFIASQLVKTLQQAEMTGQLAPDQTICVIPSVNPFSMNIEKRFWALDNTDINRMFPGYNQGETTQRIAAALFEYIKDFKYGIQLASFYLPGDFIPHIRMIKTGYEDVKHAKLFGLPYVSLREPSPFDTVLLNYNWQIWETSAFSLFAGGTESIDMESSLQAVEAIYRFMYKIGVCMIEGAAASTKTEIIEENELITIQASHAGILLHCKKAGSRVHKDEVIARIIDPYEGELKVEVKCPTEGRIFFARNKSLTYQNTVLFRIKTIR